MQDVQPVHSPVATTSWYRFRHWVFSTATPGV